VTSAAGAHHAAEHLVSRMLIFAAGNPSSSETHDDRRGVVVGLLIHCTF
jgi:hypothetical protein